MSDRLPPPAWSLYGLGLAIVIASLGATAVAYDVWLPLRAIAAGGLVLWAPGFALTMVLFPPGALGGAERALLSFVTSLALTMIPAVILEAAGVRLGTASFLGTACLTTWLAAVIALVRLRPLADVSAAARWPRPRLVPIAATLGLCVVLAGSVLAARRTPQPAGLVGSSAFAVASASPRSVLVEVVSAELEVTRYRVAVVTKAVPVELARFRLAPGGTWRQALDRPAGSGATELFLYREGERIPYRRLVVPSVSA